MSENLENGILRKIKYMYVMSISISIKQLRPFTSFTEFHWGVYEDKWLVCTLFHLYSYFWFAAVDSIDPLKLDYSKTFNWESFFLLF